MGWEKRVGSGSLTFCLDLGSPGLSRSQSLLTVVGWRGCMSVRGEGPAKCGASTSCTYHVYGAGTGEPQVALMHGH